MKTFSELTPEQQEAATVKQAEILVSALAQRDISFESSYMQAIVDIACAEADDAGENREDRIVDALWDDIVIQARSIASYAMYAEPHEFIVTGIIKKER